jgi:deoxyadenosine/deoxycytidine kinase
MLLLYYVLGTFILLWVYFYLNGKKVPKVLVIEGIIGAGKTTLLQILPKILKDKYRKIVVIAEPVDFWDKSGALADFYSNIPLKSYEFQTFVFVTRIANLRKVYKEHSDADLYIVERSPFTDKKIFAEMLRKSGMLSEQQMMKYELWWSLWEELWCFKMTHFIHLAPGVKVAQERKAKRDRTGESEVSDKYQEDLLQQHLLFFNDKFPYPLLTLTNDGDFREDADVQNKLKEQILEFLGNK